MKRFATIVALLSFACVANAQLVRVEPSVLVNRADAQTGAFERPAIHMNSPMNPQEAPTSFSISFDATSVELVPGQTVSILGTIANTTSADVQLKFFRYHLHIPDTWTSSICFGENCYAPRVDSFSEFASYTLPAGTVNAEFRLNLYCPSDYNGTDSVVDYVRFEAYGSDASDTVSGLFTGYYQGQNSAQDIAPPADKPKITSVFPSPLLNGNSIRLRVSVPHDMGFTYSISDEVGRQVAFGTSRVHLHAGDDNICEIGELNGFTNGNYTVKFSFADGSVDSRMFQIMR